MSTSNKHTKNEITLITTKGCEGCSIMNNVILKSLDNLNIPVTYKVKDISEISKDFIIRYNITDFPTTLIFVNDKYIEKITGTKAIFYMVKLFVKNFD